MVCIVLDWCLPRFSYWAFAGVQVGLERSTYFFGLFFNRGKQSINTYRIVFNMKQLKPDLANTIVRTVGWSSIKDTNSIVTKKDIEVALQYFDKDMLIIIK